MKRRIGIYPGTFDPIHVGHIAFAKKSLEECQLDEIIFIPEHSPRHKPHATHVTHRLKLIELATCAAPNLRAQRLSSKRFTVDETLPELRYLFGDAHLALLIGSDTAQTLPMWDGLDTLLKTTSIIIGMREEDSSTDIETLLKKYPAQPTFIYTDHADAASSSIRSDLTLYASLQDDVQGYIRLHKLYE